MRKDLKRLLDEPGNDLIVLPFYHPYQYGFVATRMIPLRCEGRDGFHFLCQDFYDPEQHPHGSCIQ